MTLFVAQFRPGLLELAQKKLTQAQWVALLVILDRLERDRPFTAGTTSLARDADQHVSSFARNVSGLVEQDVVRRMPVKQYLINPRLFWCGTEDGRQKWIAKWDSGELDEAPQ